MPSACVPHRHRYVGRRMSLLVTLALLLTGVTATKAIGGVEGNTQSAPHGTASAPVLSAADEAITATGDNGGWHLFAAGSGDGWRWHSLATLRPAGDDERGWIGQQCLT